MTTQNSSLCNSAPQHQCVARRRHSHKGLPLRGTAITAPTAGAIFPAAARLLLRRLFFLAEPCEKPARPREAWRCCMLPLANHWQITVVELRERFHGINRWTPDGPALIGRLGPEVSERRLARELRPEVIVQRDPCQRRPRNVLDDCFLLGEIDLHRPRDWIEVAVFMQMLD